MVDKRTADQVENADLIEKIVAAATITVCRQEQLPQRTE